MRLSARATGLGKAIFAACLIYWLVATKRLNIKDFGPFLEASAVAIGLILSGINIFILSERWRYLIGSQSKPLTTQSTTRLTLIGLFFNFAMPGGVGGDFIKAYYLQKEQGLSRSLAFSSALMDRITGLYTAVAMALVALVIEYSAGLQKGALTETLLKSVGFIFVAQTGGLLALVFLKWPEKYNHQIGLVGKVFRFMLTCRHYVANSKRFVIAILLTVVGQFFTIVFFYWALHNILGQSINWATLFFIIPVGFMVMSIPLTPAGIGVGQAAFFYLFQNFSQVSVTSGPAVITSLQLFQFAWGLVGAYYYLNRRSGDDILNIQKSH
jgi:uncharacterized protein (TIRG00374 family)